MTRLVIDSNRLRSEELRAFLGRSCSNIAVLIDYIAIEGYKGDDPHGILQSMSVLSDFPSQVTILKATSQVCNLSGRSAGLQKRLIDFDQTRGFGTYLKDLRAVQAGNVGLQRQLLSHASTAQQQMHRIYTDTKSFAEGIAEIAKELSMEERRLIRERMAFPSELIDKTMKNVLRVSAQLFSGHPNIQRIPTYDELLNTYIFRYSLCAYFLALDWGASGGVIDAKPERHQNDLIDMSFAAYATFFDGLLSADAKCMSIYKRARSWLTKVLRVR